MGQAPPPPPPSASSCSSCRALSATATVYGHAREAPTIDHRDLTVGLLEECVASVFALLGYDDRNSCSLICRRWHLVDAKSRRRLALLARSKISPSLPPLLLRFSAVSVLPLKCSHKLVSLGDDALARCEEEKLVKMVETVRILLQPDSRRGPHVAQYNVFLNFRGTDTRHGFTYGLYTNLRRAGVSVFKGDTDLLIGEDFGSQLLSAISRSTIYITILSPNYASSMWCLRELDKMRECAESMGHLLIPIFHEVNTSTVRHQREKFAHALRQHEVRPGGKFAAEVARAALKHVSNISGFILNRGGYDEQTIPHIVEVILDKLRHRFKLAVPEHLLRSRDVEEP